jgi:DDE superfamily endonuclease
MEASEYIAYLLSEPKGSSCVRGGKVLQVSHDEVNRFLAGGKFTGKDLFDKALPLLEPTGGTVSVDDTVIDKPFSDTEKTELVAKFYSGRHHKTVLGINLIVLHYTDIQGVSVPVNWRVYRHREGKSKNDYFKEMYNEVLLWGLQPSFVTADAWYSSVENLKFLRDREVGFMIGLEKNRIVSTAAHCYQKLEQIAIPQQGLYLHLKAFDFIKVFQTVDQEGYERYYGVYMQDNERGRVLGRESFERLRLQHWKIEHLFRAVKQVGHLGHFFVRRTSAIKTHLFCVLRAFQRLIALTLDKFIQSVYQLRENLFLDAQRNFILQFA